MKSEIQLMEPYKHRQHGTIYMPYQFTNDHCTVATRRELSVSYASPCGALFSCTAEEFLRDHEPASWPQAEHA